MSFYRTASICALALCVGTIGCSKPKPTILDNRKAMATLGAHPPISQAVANMTLAPTSGSGSHDGSSAIKYTTPGWYLTNSSSTSLLAGPYADEASCKNNETRVSAGIAAQGASTGQTPTQCVSLSSAPQ